MKNKDKKGLTHFLATYGFLHFIVLIGSVIYMAFFLTSHIVQQKSKLIILSVVCVAVTADLLFFIISLLWPLNKAEKHLNMLSKGEKSLTDDIGNFGVMSETVRQITQMLKEVADKKYEEDILKKEAELDALQGQINPHFLYNTLESIRGQAIIKEDYEIADMTEALSVFFRYSISGTGNVVSLEEEIRNVKSYFKIQQFRFNNRFDINIICENEKDLIQCKLPKLTIQPIVENSIYHGLESKMGHGTIEIRIVGTQNRIIVIISDDGHGMSFEALQNMKKKLKGEYSDQRNKNKKHSGIALSNVNKRIKLLFGDEYGIDVSSTLGLGTDVEITLPRKLGDT